MKEVLTGGFITLSAQMRKGEISKVNKLLPEEMREEQIVASRRREGIKMRAETSEVGTGNQRESTDPKSSS